MGKSPGSRLQVSTRCILVPVCLLPAFLLFCSTSSRPLTDAIAPEVADVGLDLAADTGLFPDTASPPKTFFLVNAGQSSHVLVLDPAASPSEKRAAQEFQDVLHEATGANIPIQDMIEPGRPAVVIGLGLAARELGVDPAPEVLGEQGFVVRAVPPSLVIAGTPAAGTMYGVHRFLEEFVGVRWLAPDVTRIPKTADIAVPETLDRIVKPAFRWRTTSYEWPGADAAFRAHVAMNSGKAGPDAEYGAQHAMDGQAHSYFWYVSPDEFFDTHPEYFSEIGGVRIRDETQLCLTNPDVLEIVTERMLERMAKKPDALQHNFSQMDHFNGCECPKCRAINEQYGTPGGTQFWFVNQLAERTAKVYPHKQIGTLAYTYTEAPPKGMTMHPNVAVWLCHMYPSCDSHSIQDCPHNATYKARAEAWSKITSHLYIWHYIVNFTHYYVPFPNFGSIVKDLQFYRSIGVEGIFLQGMGHEGGGGEFSLLRPYYGMKLLWDPDLDPSRLMDEFLDGYYGPAAGPIRAWIDLLQKKVDDEHIHMHLYTNPAQGYLPDTVVQTGETLFDEAEDRVQDDAELLDRVRVARMPLVYARFFPRNGYAIADGKLKWNPGIATMDEVLDFIDRMTSHGFTTIREASGGTDTLLLLYAILGSDQDVVTLRNPVLSVDVVPMLAGRALRVTHRPTGQTVTAWDVRPGLFYPFSGGWEDRVGVSTLAFGWVEPTTAQAEDERIVTVSMTTFDGWGLKRRYSLDPVEPVLRVETTVTNPTGTAREAVVRNHLELDLGDVRKTRMRFVQRSGATVDEDMTGVIAALRLGKRFWQQEVPAGAWTFSGTKGLDVTQRFDDATVDSTWVYAYPDTLNEVEVEVWSPRKALGPGESLTVVRELRVEPTPPGRTARNAW